MVQKILFRDTIPGTRIEYRRGQIINRWDDTRVNDAVGDAIRNRIFPTKMDATRYLFDQKYRFLGVLDGRDVNGTGVVGTAWSSPATGSVITDSWTSAGTDAQTKALAALYNAHASLGETLVEAAQTYDMFAKSLKRIDSILESLHRGSRKKLSSSIGKPVSKRTYRKVVDARKTGREAVDGALAVQYGWLPIVSFMEDVARTYATGLYERGQTIHKRSGTKQSQDWERVAKTPLRDLARGHASFKFKVKNANLANANGLGLINPMREAWNKVGLSFVFDWFIPVGTYLSAWTSSAGLELLYGSRTQTAVTILSKTFKGSKVPYQISRVGTRIPVISIPAPSLDVLWTGNGLSSVSKAISVALLGAQRFSKPTSLRR